MNWKTLLAEIQATGLSQMQIANRLGKSQAWVSAAAAGQYGDLKWQDGEALIALHAETVAPLTVAPPVESCVVAPKPVPACGSIDPRHSPDRRYQDKRQRIEHQKEAS